MTKHLLAFIVGKSIEPQRRCRDGNIGYAVLNVELTMLREKK